MFTATIIAVDGVVAVAVNGVAHERAATDAGRTVCRICAEIDAHRPTIVAAVAGGDGIVRERAVADAGRAVCGIDVEIDAHRPAKSRCCCVYDLIVGKHTPSCMYDCVNNSAAYRRQDNCNCTTTHCAARRVVEERAVKHAEHARLAV
jgi:hypothetical protein